MVHDPWEWDDADEDERHIHRQARIKLWLIVAGNVVGFVGLFLLTRWK